MDTKILDFNWNDKNELQKNLKKWAYSSHDESVWLAVEDEDLLFHDIEMIRSVFPYMLDKTCSKRGQIISYFLDFIRLCFLGRTDYEINQIETNFIHEMTSSFSFSGDDQIGECVSYFTSCKVIYQDPKPADFDQVKKIGRLLLNGLTNSAVINEPTISENGNFQITSTTSAVTLHLCVNKQTGHYKFNGYELCE